MVLKTRLHHDRDVSNDVISQEAVQGAEILSMCRASLKPYRGLGLVPRWHTSQFHSPSLESQDKRERLKIFHSVLAETSYILSAGQCKDTSRHRMVCMYVYVCASTCPCVCVCVCLLTLEMLMVCLYVGKECKSSRPFCLRHISQEASIM